MGECTIPDIGPLLAFIIVLAVYQFTEIHYFARLLLCYLRSLVKDKLHVLDTAELTSICLTTDIDYMLTHMNNARYIRELDFARIEFILRTSLWPKIRERKGQLYVSAISVRYRRFIKLFAFYRISTRIVYWDRHTVYIEHRFVTTSDNFVRAIVYSQLKAVGCDVDEIMDQLIQKTTAEGSSLMCHKPQCPPEIRLWIESSKVSSSTLRAHS